MKRENSLMTARTAQTCERTDLLIEVLNAMIETQDSYAKDWTRALHGKAWEAGRKASAAQ